MVGQACAMLGAASWQILASVLKMPVSGTHSIVGAVLGRRYITPDYRTLTKSTGRSAIVGDYSSSVSTGRSAVGYH